MGSKEFKKPKFIKDSQKASRLNHTLIIYNDDFNLYDYIIDSLVEVCDHNPLQAEQCTLIAHHRGKCDVKTGEFSQLKSMKDELTRRGISAVITS
ncbi:MAG: ATP-dependent Clp protease adaptor ClpS [Bacteroidales bacterium]